MPDNWTHSVSVFDLSVQISSYTSVQAWWTQMDHNVDEEATNGGDHMYRYHREFTMKQPEMSGDSPSSSPALHVSSPVPDTKSTTVFFSSAAGKDDEGEKVIRRSSSLRVHKECTSTTPAQKKIVRFADVLGLDLASVRTFLDELPNVPNSAYGYHEEDADKSPSRPPASLLRKSDSESSLPLPLPLPSESYVCETKSLLPLFKSPIEWHDLVNRIRDNRICLQSVSVHDTPVCHLKGRIKVQNLDYRKNVYVRYTLDGWKTYDEVQASYLPPSESNDNDNNVHLGLHQLLLDEFTFVIYIYNVVAVGQKVEFAIRYLCRDSEHWDNNYGHNYTFQCCLDTPALPSYFHCNANANISPSASCTDNFHSFY
ncbi:glycogen-binding subunit 76A [Planococcus citri]|uniref:glycogen-binding subunit 76A n=1 Tax=Planococcus citri TaxID=170843 RepID=UPI0031F8903A